MSELRASGDQMSREPNDMRTHTHTITTGRRFTEPCTRAQPIGHRERERSDKIRAEQRCQVIIKHSRRTRSNLAGWLAIAGCAFNLCHQPTNRGNRFRYARVTRSRRRTGFGFGFDCAPQFCGCCGAHTQLLPVIWPRTIVQTYATRHRATNKQ